MSCLLLALPLEINNLFGSDIKFYTTPFNTGTRSTVYCRDLLVNQGTKTIITIVHQTSILILSVIHFVSTRASYFYFKFFPFSDKLGIGYLFINLPVWQICCLFQSVFYQSQVKQTPTVRATMTTSSKGWRLGSEHQYKRLARPRLRRQ